MGIIEFIMLITVKIPVILDMLSQGLMIVCIVATALAMFTPSDVDDAKVESMATKVQKFLSWMPTFGVNPRTKKLEEALNALRAHKKKRKRR